MLEKNDFSASSPQAARSAGVAALQLPQVLSQLTDPSKPVDIDGTSNGRVLGALLMTRHGALLGSSGFDRAAMRSSVSGGGGEPPPTAKNIGAIVSNVWGEYAGGIARGAEALGRRDEVHGGKALHNPILLSHSPA